MIVVRSSSRRFPLDSLLHPRRCLKPESSKPGAREADGSGSRHGTGRRDHRRCAHRGSRTRRRRPNRPPGRRRGSVGGDESGHGRAPPNGKPGRKRRTLPQRDVLGTASSSRAAGDCASPTPAAHHCHRAPVVGRAPTRPDAPSPASSWRLAPASRLRICEKSWRPCASCVLTRWPILRI
jgi:hypothetical protein